MYPYDELQDGEIRLLRLQPDMNKSCQWSPDDRASSHLMGLLESFSLKVCPSYIALSYCWGTDQPSNPMILNGQSHLLRNNLHSLLRRLEEHQQENIPLGRTLPGSPDRLEIVKTSSEYLPIAPNPTGTQTSNSLYLGKTPSLIWTDALCINQQSMLEKTAQLAMLRDIYAKADRIIIWLGELDESSKRAINTWRQLVSWARSSSHDRPGLTLSPEQCQALKDFGERDYWRRVWIWQEASTPRATREIWCGTERISFEDAVLGNNITREWLLTLNRTPQINPWNAELEDLNTLGHLRQLQQRLEGAGSSGLGIVKGWDSLASMLYTTMDLRATDPRDKIYALLPVYADIRHIPLNRLIYEFSFKARVFGKDEPGELVRLEYDLPLEDIYQRAALFMLTIEHDLRALLLCTLVGPRVATNSWIPNFKNMFRRFNLFDYHHLFNACLNTKPAAKALANQKIITVKGIYLDAVASVHPPLATFDDNIPPASIDFKTARLKQWGKSLAKFIYPDGIDCSYLGTIPLSEAADLLLALHCAPGVILERSNNVTHWPIRDMSAGISISPINTQKLDFTDLLLRVGYASVFWTKNGYLGLGDPSVRQNDQIIICNGLSIPISLRHTGIFNIIVGPCYVQGVMDGEFLQGKYRTSNFEIF